jgi:CBS-domain-containing membrane protein
MDGRPCRQVIPWGKAVTGASEKKVRDDMKSTVKNIMTTQVVAVHRSTSFKEMAARLRKERVSAFPVVDDDGTVVGVVSETDLLPKETLDAGMGRPDTRNDLTRPG